MRPRLHILVCPLLLALAVSASAQSKGKDSTIQDTARPVGAPAVTEFTGPPMETRPMPGDRIDKPTSLDDEMDAIRAAIPEFNSVVVREPGVSNDYPTLPSMTLKNVTVGQFLQFVMASYPGVTVRRIDGPSGSLYSIRVRLDEESLRKSQMMQERNRVRLYRLTDVINDQADQLAAKDAPTTNESENHKARSEYVKEATTQVLSLLQAALDQVDADSPMVLKMHEATLTLMFKGSLPKQTVLEEAIQTLQPRYAPKRFGKTMTFGSGGSAATLNDMNMMLQSEPFDPDGPVKIYQEALADQRRALARQQADMERAKAEMDRAKAGLGRFPKPAPQALPAPVAPPAPPAPVAPSPAPSKD
jgi:hypothetical protein